MLNEKPTEWSYIIEGILFAHRVSRHSSAQYSPFYLWYNREPILPIDVKFNLADRKNDDTEPFDRETFEAVLASATTIREIHESASNNITKSSRGAKKDFDRRHLSSSDIKAGNYVLLRNNKRNDRKGWKFSFVWLGPYVVS